MLASLLLDVAAVAPAPAVLDPALIVAITTAVVALLGAITTLIVAVFTIKGKINADAVEAKKVSDAAAAEAKRVADAATHEAEARLKVAEATHAAVNSGAEAMRRSLETANKTINDLTAQLAPALAEIARLLRERDATSMASAAVAAVHVPAVSTLAVQTPTPTPAGTPTVVAPVLVVPK